MVSKHLWLNKVTLGLLALLLVFVGMVGSNLSSLTPAYADGKLSGCSKSNSGAVATGTCSYSSDGLSPTPPTSTTTTGIIPGGSGTGGGRSTYVACYAWDARYNSATGPFGATSYPIPPDAAAASCPSYAGTFYRDSKKTPTDTPQPASHPYTCVVNGDGVSASDMYSWTDGVWHESSKGRWYLQWWSACIYPSKSDSTPDRQELNAQGYCLTKGKYTVYYGGSSAINSKTGGSVYYTSPVKRTDFRYNAGFKKNGPSASNPCPTDLKIEWKTDDAPTIKSGVNAGQPQYGFYRISVDAQARFCQKVIPKAWQKTPSYYECDDETDAPDAHYRYTYTCLSKGLYEATGNPEQVKDSDKQYFDVTNCMGPYSCKAAGTKIAGQAYDATNQGADVTVMRNGKAVPVKFGGISLSGEAIDNNRIRNVKITSRKTTLVTPSSPYNSSVSLTDPLQSFRLYRNTNAVPFNSYYDVNYPDNDAYTVAYWMASNPGGKWQIKSSYLYSATFYPYVQNTWTGPTHQQATVKTGQTCSDGNDVISYSNSARVVVARGVNSN